MKTQIKESLCSPVKKFKETKVEVIPYVTIVATICELPMGRCILRCLTYVEFKKWNINRDWVAPITDMLEKSVKHLSSQADPAGAVISLENDDSSVVSNLTNMSVGAETEEEESKMGNQDGAAQAKLKVKESQPWQSTNDARGEENAAPPDRERTNDQKQQRPTSTSNEDRDQGKEHRTAERATDMGKETKKAGEREPHGNPMEDDGATEVEEVDALLISPLTLIVANFHKQDMSNLDPKAPKAVQGTCCLLQKAETGEG